MIRETKEETGIALEENRLRVIHVMHRKSNDERVDFFFETKKWLGEPKIMEPEKCDDLKWFPIIQLPENTIPYVRAAIENYKNNISFSEFGW